MNAIVLDEPQLLFGGDFPSSDPKSGISLYGPYSTSRSSIRIGIVGDKQTTTKILQILQKCKNPVEAPTQYPIWTQDFPGISKDSPFKCDLLVDDRWNQIITTSEIDKLDRLKYLQERVSYSVDLFVKYIVNLKEREESPDVVICGPPRKMMDMCISPGDLRTPNHSRGGSNKSDMLPTAQSSIIDFMPEFKESLMDALIRKSAENIHHLLKAKSMNLTLPIQFVLPNTLDVFTQSSNKKLQDEATFAWNFCVALLYKSGGRPWKPADLSLRTCFVGISFYKEKPVFGGGVGTSVAQVFTPEGEGLVLRGERLEWKRGRSPHLTKSAAERLLEKAIALYKRQTKQKPTRIILHKSSNYWQEEVDGFKAAMSEVPTYDFVSIMTDAKGIKFFRTGYNPVIRGTMITLLDNAWLLYSKGYIPQLKLYPGAHIPNPLEIFQYEGDSTPEVISKEILTLTKLNWNNADFAGQLPITLQFSRQVGTILRELPPGVTPANRYLYYM